MSLRPLEDSAPPCLLNEGMHAGLQAQLSSASKGWMREPGLEEFSREAGRPHRPALLLLTRAWVGGLQEGMSVGNRRATGALSLLGLFADLKSGVGPGCGTRSWH